MWLQQILFGAWLLIGKFLMGAHQIGDAFMVRQAHHERTHDSLYERTREAGRFVGRAVPALR